MPPGPDEEGGLSTKSSTKLSTRRPRRLRNGGGARQTARRRTPSPGSPDGRQRQSASSSSPSNGSEASRRLPSRSTQSAREATAADAAIAIDVSSMQPRKRRNPSS